MPVLRNPFRKQDENARPGAIPTQPGDKTNGTDGVNGAKSVDIKDNQPTEYKLSEINDSGVYLPPSPPERKSFWSTTSSRSTTSTNHRSAINEHEQFNISRESFDSYRRSFDISARSPILTPGDGRPSRVSLDSRTFQAPPARTSNSFTRPSQVPAQTREEAFEDVDIADPVKPQQKKRGIFSRMVDGSGSDHAERPASQEGPKQGWTHHLGVGRKRGQSGQGAELGTVPQPSRQETPRPESQLRKETVPQTQVNGVALAPPNGVNGDGKQAAMETSDPQTADPEQLIQGVKTLDVKKDSTPQSSYVPNTQEVVQAKNVPQVPEPVQAESSQPATPNPENSRAPAVTIGKVES